MSLQFVIDGYNITNCLKFSRINKKKDNSVNSLLYLISAEKLCGSLNNKIIVVFDGFNSNYQLGHGAGNIDVIFSRHISADDKIKQIIESFSNKKNIVVVSDDKEIVYFTKLSGAFSLGTDEFLNKISVQKNKINKMKDKQIEEGKDLNYSQMHKINEELKKIWLR